MDSYFEGSNSIFSDIYLLFCGIQKCTPLYAFGPAVRDCHLLHICLEGRGSFYESECKYIIEKGQGFLIYPGELTFYQADGQQPWTYLWIALGGEKIEQFLQLAGFSRENRICHTSQPEKLQACVTDIIAHNTLSYANEIYIQGALLTFLSCLTADAGVPYAAGEKVANMYINKAISYIQRNYQNNVTVREIADYLSLNRSYLTELFVKHIHISPQQFLMQYRITKATELLKNTDLTVENVAYSCGYANGLSFSKAFKKVTGRSPTEYRKENKNANK